VCLLRFLNGVSGCTVHVRTIRIKEIPTANLKLLRMTALTQEVQTAVTVTPRSNVKKMVNGMRTEQTDKYNFIVLYTVILWFM
jgi:hypothetical protein